MEEQFTRQAENALKLAKTTAQVLWTWIYRHRASSGRSFEENEGTAGKVLGRI